MLHLLASHNDDIRRLLEKGYAISFDSNFLVIRDVPYLDDQKSLNIGAIISKVVFVDTDHITLDDHQVFFCGSHPHEIDGSEIKNLGGGVTTLALEATDIIVERSFSNKPFDAHGNLRVFIDFYEKIESYVGIISGPALQLYPEKAKVLTFRSVDSNSESVFKFNDTLTSRAEIGELAVKFKEDVIAIIGLGGTGAYILDYLAKTPVKEIRAFDGDSFHIHNAFRSPGKVEKAEFGKRKTDVYQNRYAEFRHGINFHSKYILSDSKEELDGVTFAFVCVDKGSSRADIFQVLAKLSIPFIDVGMGLYKNKGTIDGLVRTTFYPTESAQEMIEKKLAPVHDDAEDIYKTNIQLSELNALNACLAVIRFKQIREFYFDDSNFNHLLFSIHDLDLVGE
jgi:molybdopterin/thiamine biosynthesis adenylyltransferase